MQLLGNLAAEGDPGQLRDWGDRVGLDSVGGLIGRRAALADFDADGDLDVAINQIAGPAVVLRNDGAPGAGLVIAPEPPSPGTTVTVELSDGSRLRGELYAGSSYLSSHEPRLHFGLGEATAVTVTVTWPDGAESIVTGVSGVVVEVFRAD